MHLNMVSDTFTVKALLRASVFSIVGAPLASLELDLQLVIRSSLRARLTRGDLADQRHDPGADYLVRERPAGLVRVSAWAREDIRQTTALLQPSETIRDTSHFLKMPSTLQPLQARP